VSLTAKLSAKLAEKSGAKTKSSAKMENEARTAAHRAWLILFA
jgi:hypothetical protein